MVQVGDWVLFTLPEQHGENHAGKQMPALVIEVVDTAKQRVNLQRAKPNCHGFCLERGVDYSETPAMGFWHRRA